MVNMLFNAPDNTQNMTLSLDIDNAPSMVEKIVLVSMGGFGCLAGLFATHVIRTYHYKKPLGMQSFLSKVICLSATSADITANIVLILIAIKLIINFLDYEVVLFMTFLAHCAAHGYVFTVNILLATKYLSIYFR